MRKSVIFVHDGYVNRQAMKTFLQILARDMMDKYGGRFEGVTVIFPNKRAGLFLAEELAKLIDRPVWMPEMVTLAEYVERHTGLRQADSLTLAIKLYKVYRKVTGTEERFEDFYFWGNMLLGDFDDVDKYLADARDLFSNLVALKKLESKFPYLTEEQVEAVKRFWDSFNPEKFSREQEEFLKVWNGLYGTYTAFREALEREGLCYEGMNERRFYEHIAEYEHPQQLVVAGFNALNACERGIFDYYRDAGVASFYWDYDVYYTADEHQEAGRYIRENLKRYPQTPDMGHFNHFLHNGKQVEYISVPSAVGQAKLLGQLTEHVQGENPRDTAVVLCDEQMLVPVLHSIPESIRKINVTMGYPAQKTSVAALVALLCDLKGYARREGKDTYYYYKPVVALLNHKLVREACPEGIARKTEEIARNNSVYVAERDLHLDPLTEAIFSSGEEKVTAYLLRVLDRLGRSEAGERAEPVEREFIFSIYTQIQHLQNVFEEEGIEPEEKLYTQLVGKVVGSISIPFSGEPLEGLQVMGLMETRMLDFKHLIVLSANEGTLPKTTLPSSFIPYNLRVGFRLPTPEHQDALFAYYFYRLLQRAQDVKILYTSGMKGVNGGEMSRFLYQMKYESGLPIRESSFQNRISAQNPREIAIPKTEEVMARLEEYTVGEEKALSPSALNIYMECPLRFYFRYVTGIEEKEELAEELDQRLLGNIFHACSQSLYETVPDGEVTAEAIDALLADEALMDEHIRRAYGEVYDEHVSRLLESGSNELVLSVVKKYLRQMLQYDRQVVPFRLLAMERRFHVPVAVGTGAGRRTVYVGGFIDRVDRTADAIRVIDYKTGKDRTDFKGIASVFDPENASRNKAAFQTMLYCLMFDHVHPSREPLVPGIYSTRLLFEKDYDCRLRCDGTAMADFRRFEEEYREELEALLARLFSTEVPFTQTEDGNKCKTCSYAGICRRGK